MVYKEGELKGLALINISLNVASEKTLQEEDSSRKCDVCGEELKYDGKYAIGPNWSCKNNHRCSTEIILLKEMRNNSE